MSMKDAFWFWVEIWKTMIPALFLYVIPITIFIVLLWFGVIKLLMFLVL